MSDSPSPDWVVLKFGGTSVASRERWDAIARRVAEVQAEGARVLVVCSAINGVTDALEVLPDARDAAAALSTIMDRHADLAVDLQIAATDILHEGKARLEAALRGCQELPGPASQAQLLAQGEWLSSRLGHRFLDQNNSAAWVDAREALSVIPEQNSEGKRAWLSARCEALADRELEARWAALPAVLVAQGFVARSPDGSTALLGRGGSDTSAALLASRLTAQRIEIWTDVPGLYSADPRKQPDARLIRDLDYAEALEMAAGGAVVIHGRSIRAAAEAGIPLLIRDLSRPEMGGTRIGSRAPNSRPGIRAVTCTHEMVVLLLENLDTRQQVGFLAWVFEVIADAGVSVDQVATSETTTTLAINTQANHLDAVALANLAEQLSQRCHVQQYVDCTCVNLVGRGARLALADLDVTADYFQSHPLLMMSQSANDLSISLLVETPGVDDLMDGLHRRLVVSA